MYSVWTERSLDQIIQVYNTKPPVALNRLQRSRTLIGPLVADSSDYADLRIWCKFWPLTDCCLNACLEYQIVCHWLYMNMTLWVTCMYTLDVPCIRSLSTLFMFVVWDTKYKQVYPKYQSIDLKLLHCLLSIGGSPVFQLSSKFSTYDQDVKESGGRTACAARYHSGWWFGVNGWCFYSNLNGLYLRGNNSKFDSNGVVWYQWTGYHYSLRFTEMKIKPY